MRKEIYEIHKDGHLFAQFDWGDPERGGNSMNRKTFEREFESCVGYWRSQGSKASFEMRIRVIEPGPAPGKG